ncbi:MAG: HlyD family secretion protein [Bilophila sp.]
MRVTISGLVLKNAILVPQQAVIQTQKGSMVVVVKDGKAEMRPVDLGDNYGDSFLLNKGLEPGERIVIEGGNKAVPGQPVRVEEAKAPQSAPLPDQPVSPEEGAPHAGTPASSGTGATSGTAPSSAAPAGTTLSGKAE